MAWYVRIMGDVQGPFTNEQFKAQADARRIDKTTEVAKDPKGPWFPATNVPNLFSAPPPLPVAASRQQVVSPVNAVANERPRKTSRAAGVSLGLGIASYLLYAFCGGLGILVGMLAAVPAIICGAIGLNQITHSQRDTTGPSVSGSWLAVVGAVIGAASLAGGTMWALFPTVHMPPGAAKRSQCMANLSSVSLGMAFAESEQLCLPAAIVDANGRPLLSWRVAILPFIGEKPLFDEFHLSEPWNSEHNLALIPRMPDVYRCPAMPPDATAGHTSYLAAAGPGMALDKPTVQQTKLYGARISGVRTSELSDGLSGTILVVELGHDAAVPWTKPEDLTCSVGEAYARLFQSAPHPGGSCALFADGAKKHLEADMDPEYLEARLTRSGKEPTTSDEP